MNVVEFFDDFVLHNTNLLHHLLHHLVLEHMTLKLHLHFALLPLLLSQLLMNPCQLLDYLFSPFVEGGIRF